MCIADFRHRCWKGQAQMPDGVQGFLEATKGEVLTYTSKMVNLREFNLFTGVKFMT